MTLKSHILQAHPHPKESAEDYRNRWRDREVVSVCQSTLARWREGQFTNHSLPILAQNHIETMGKDHSCLIRAFWFKARCQRWVGKYRSVESNKWQGLGAAECRTVGRLFNYLDHASLWKIRRTWWLDANLFENQTLGLSTAVKCWHPSPNPQRNFTGGCMGL